MQYDYTESYAIKSFSRKEIASLSIKLSMIPVSIKIWTQRTVNWYCALPPHNSYMPFQYIDIFKQLIKNSSVSLLRLFCWTVLQRWPSDGTLALVRVLKEVRGSWPTSCGNRSLGEAYRQGTWKPRSSSGTRQWQEQRYARMCGSEKSKGAQKWRFGVGEHKRARK